MTLVMKAYFNSPKMAPSILLKMPSAAMFTRPVNKFARKKSPTHISVNINIEQIRFTVNGLKFPIMCTYGCSNPLSLNAAYVPRNNAPITAISKINPLINPRTRPTRRRIANVMSR